MRLAKLSTILAVGAVLLLSLPVFADTYTIFYQPTDGVYLPSTINYGGGDGSGNTISSLGPFIFSSPLVQLSVPGSWATWNCPPATESCTPNVLYTNGATTIHLISGGYNTVGVEVEPDAFAVETISVTFNDQFGQPIATIIRDVNGSGGALLFALQDDTPGKWISHIDVEDLNGGDFAIAELRQGNSVPEPGTLLMFGSAVLGIAGTIRRKLF